MIYLNTVCEGNCRFCSLRGVPKQQFDYNENDLISIWNIIKQIYPEESEVSIFGGEVVLNEKEIWKALKTFKISFNKVPILEWVTGLHRWNDKIRIINTYLKQYDISNVVLAISFDGTPEWDDWNRRYPKGHITFEDAIKKIRDQCYDNSRLYISTKKVISPQESDNNQFIKNDNYISNILERLVGHIQKRNYVFAYPFFIWDFDSADSIAEQIKHLGKFPDVNKHVEKFLTGKPYYGITCFDNKPIVRILRSDKKYSYNSEYINNIKKIDIKSDIIKNQCQGCPYVSFCGNTCRQEYVSSLSYLPYCYIIHKVMGNVNGFLERANNHNVLNQLNFNGVNYDHILTLFKPNFRDIEFIINLYNNYIDKQMSKDIINKFSICW